MKQHELIEAFINRGTKGTVKRFFVDGTQLIHYNTAIAELIGEKIILNYIRYSLAADKVQKTIADAIGLSRLVYVSSVPSDTRSSLVAYPPQTGFPVEMEPVNYLMHIEHEEFGTGYVIPIEAGLMSCKFGWREENLMLPMVIDSGIVKIIEDKR